MKNLLLIVALLLASLCLVGCPKDTAHHASVRAIVGAGSLVESLAQQNDALYRRETDALRERLRASGGSLDEYRRQVAPMDGAHLRRAVALATLADAMHSAARVIDLARRNGTTGEYMSIATEVLASVERALGELRGGGLPSLEIPSEIDATRASLRVVAGAVAR